jgi:STE24 endopeptidase
LIVFGLETYLDFRQLHNFKTAKKVDSHLEKHIDSDTFTKTLKYNAAKYSFSIFETILTLVQGITLLVLGFMPWSWDFATNTATKYGLINNANSDLYKEFIVTLIFFGIVTAFEMVWSLPFQLWKTFVIEEKYGFNKQTLRLFFEDKIKYVLLLFVIGSPITGGIIAIVRWGGPNFYFYVWGFCFVVMMIMMFIFPEYIAPWFNKYEPLTDGPLYSAIETLANRDDVKFPLTKLFVMDGSKRSAHSNAFFYGFFKNKRIVLFDTLIKQVDTEELLAILGHEIGHWKLWHTIQGLVISQLYLFLQFLYFSYVQNSAELFTAFGFKYKGPMPVFIGLTLFSQVFMYPVDKVLNLAMNYNSRYNEFMADNYAVKLNMGEKLKSGLIKISVENLGNMVPDKLYSAYHFSHPPLVERLRAIDEALAKSK